MASTQVGRLVAPNNHPDEARGVVGRLRVRTFLRWWETLGRPERIVAMSLATGGVVAVTNSTIWAVAVCYMVRQKSLVALHARRDPEVTSAEAANAEAGYGRMTFEEGAGASVAGLRAQ